MSKKIGILSAVGLGDIISIGPLTKKLKELYPNSSITVYTQKPGFGMSITSKYIDDFHVYNNLGTLFNLLKIKHDILIGWGVHAEIKGFWKKLKYFLFFNLINASKKITYKAEIPHEDKTNTVVLKTDLLKQIGIEVKQEDYELFYPFDIDEAENQIREILKKENSNENTSRVIIHMGSQPGWETKFWPIDHWKETIDNMTKNNQSEIILIGSEYDSELAQQLLEKVVNSSQIINLVNKLDITQTAALIKTANLMISTNSGPMWLGALAKIPQIVLSGPSKKSWSPYNQNAIVIQNIQERVFCNPPCNLPKCHYNDKECMTTISPKQVSNAIDQLIKKGI